jgi:PPOX class probable F420-dependent enzyme
MIGPEERSRLAEFLAPPRIAVVATIGREGMPQLTPNWYVYSDGRLLVSTTKQRVKHRNLVRDGRVAVCVCSEPMAEEYVTVRGRADIRDDDSIWEDTRAIVERYVEPDGVEARMNMLRGEDRVIVSVEPDGVVFRT